MNLSRRVAGFTLVRATVLALVVLGTAAAAQAEYVLLRNGQRLHVTGYERDGEQVHLRVAGGVVTVAASQVLSVEPEEVFAGAVPEIPSGPYADLIREAARHHGVDEHLITSVIAAESNFDAKAVSRKNARGLMQLMPATARRLAVTDVFDPAQNIQAGTRYLKELLERYNQDFTLALAAYNAGPERVAQYGGVPPFAETRAYIRRVYAEWRKRLTEKG